MNHHVRCRQISTWLLFSSLFLSVSVIAQNPSLPFQIVENPPKDLLASKSVMLYDYRLTAAEIQETQKSFQQTGIDAVAWFQIDQVLAGKDITSAFAEYFTNRQVIFLLILTRTPDGFQLIVTAFNQKPNLFDPNQPGWRTRNGKLSELLRTVLQDSWRSQKKQNYLINEFPETDIVVNPFKGNRQEFYAIDLKVDNLAVQKSGDEKMDKDLEAIFQANYPLKYKIVEAGLTEQELRRQGFLYILCFVHTRGAAAREILGYDMSRKENAFASISFPEGQLQLKTIPAQAEIYKFYFRHIDNGNVFLGNKWDADVNWQDALKNHIAGFKLEARIN